MRLTYDQFKKEYARLFHEMMKYTPNQAGSIIFAGKMADLCEEYPEFECRYDGELC